MDDCADEDNPHALYRAIGPARAINTATALTTAALRSLLHAPIGTARRTRLLDGYLAAFLQVCRGQDQEFRGLAQSLSDYCTIVQAKTVAAFEFAALAGAYVATDDEAALDQCRACGVHLGWMIQMLDDIEALWFPDMPGELHHERQTFPVLVGLSLDHHPAALRLRQLYSADHFDAEQIRAVLDDMGVRRHLMSHALDHRDRALAALGPPCQPEGRALLQLWLDWLYRDGQRLLGH
jgi:geranylgeranyl pyrophosphate synthase